MNETIAYLVGHRADELKYQSTPKLLTQDLVGIEIEVEEFKLSKFLPETILHLEKWWEISGDPSLRGDHGYELKFNRPHAGQNIVDAIEELISLSKAVGIKPDLSERTSVHVHLDIRDLTFEQYKNFLALYVCVEPALFNYVKNNREANPYCLPMKHILGDLHKFRGLGTHQLKEKLYGLFRGSKYGALNIGATSTFGSLEFRHMGGCFDDKRLLEWINIILSLKKYVVNIDPVTFNLQRLPNKISQMGPDEFLNQIFGERLTKKLVYPTLYSDITQAVRIAQLFIFTQELKTAADWIKDQLFMHQKFEDVTEACPFFWERRNEILGEDQYLLLKFDCDSYKLLFKDLTLDENKSEAV